MLPILLTDMRAKSKRSQADIARRIGIGGGTLSTWETGFRNVTLQHLASVANAYGVTLSAIFRELEKYEAFAHSGRQETELFVGREA